MYLYEGFRSAADMYEDMLPIPQQLGHRGYYPVVSREEWDVLPDLYKTMEWEQVKDPYSGQLKAVSAVIFDVPHMEPHGTRAKVSVHPENVQKLLFCFFQKADCHLYSICGVELEGGARLPAKWLQDSISGAFAVVVNGEFAGKQGGFRGFIPEHIQRTEDGKFKFDFRYGEGKTTYYVLRNPFESQRKLSGLNKDVPKRESLDSKISQAKSRSTEQKDASRSTAQKDTSRSQNSKGSESVHIR